MISVRTFGRICGLLAVGTLLIPSAIGLAQQPAARAPVVDAKNLRMMDDALPTGGPVFGNSSQPGMYITRNRFAAGNTSRPHFHDQDRWVTVIKGTWWTGEGDVFRPETMIPIKAGGMMYHPAGYHHYDGAKDEDVIVQIMGMGPVRTTQTEVDANGQPVSGRGGAAGRGGRGATPEPGH